MQPIAKSKAASVSSTALCQRPAGLLTFYQITVKLKGLLQIEPTLIDGSGLAHLTRGAPSSRSVGSSVVFQAEPHRGTERVPPLEKLPGPALPADGWYVRSDAARDQAAGLAAQERDLKQRALSLMSVCSQDVVGQRVR
jgi:hypothetical protein